jgi:hypothetical protein
MFETHRRRLTDSEYEAIAEDVNEYIDRQEYLTLCRHAAGVDWTSGIYHPLHLACDQDDETACSVFRLIFWATLILRADRWMFLGSHANCMMFERTSAGGKDRAQTPSGPQAA